MRGSATGHAAAMRGAATGHATAHAATTGHATASGATATSASLAAAGHTTAAAHAATAPAVLCERGRCEGDRRAEQADDQASQKSLVHPFLHLWKTGRRKSAAAGRKPGDLIRSAISDYEGDRF
jgi:hypothetical protein